MKEFYPETQEDIPENLPEPYGDPIHITAYFDEDHARDKVTCRSVTGVLIFLNSIPFKFFCKRQRTVETSTYGSEIVAGRIVTELIMEVRYTLRSIGINIQGPSTMLGDNNSVILNTTVPSSMLKKKHNAVSYHRIRKPTATNIIEFGYIKSTKNYADLLTKPLESSKFHNIVKPLLFRHFDMPL